MQISFKTLIQKIDITGTVNKVAIVNNIKLAAKQAGYAIVDENDIKPWGAYFRFESAAAERFAKEMFPAIVINQLKDQVDLELSPKILLVKPGARLSWQYHYRRKECWSYLTAGAYYKSKIDDMGEIVKMEPGQAIMIDRLERHRLVGDDDHWTIVAEIWQHTNPSDPSTEDDIVRLQDDYHRE